MPDLETHFSDSLVALQASRTNMQMQAQTYLICEIESNWSLSVQTMTIHNSFYEVKHGIGLPLIA